MGSEQIVMMEAYHKYATTLHRKSTEGRVKRKNKIKRGNRNLFCKKITKENKQLQTTRYNNYAVVPIGPVTSLTKKLLGID